MGERYLLQVIHSVSLGLYLSTELLLQDKGCLRRNNLLATASLESRRLLSFREDMKYLAYSS